MKVTISTPPVNGVAGGPRALDRKTRLYMRMVKAVRAWVHEAHPNCEYVDVTDADLFGGGRIIAQFHALNPAHDRGISAQYLQGDLMALGVTGHGRVSEALG